jgi:Domain of unknown function (DUF1918)
MRTPPRQATIRYMHYSQSILRAQPGDRLVIRAHHTGEAEHDGEILEVLGEGGAPPFVVRWEQDGHVSRLYPGPDAYVQHLHGDVSDG